MFGDCHMHMVLDGVYYRDAIAAHRGHVRKVLILYSDFSNSFIVLRMMI